MAMAQPGDMFAAMDRNHDGVISREEFYSGVPPTMLPGMAPPTVYPGGMPMEPIAGGASMGAPATQYGPPQTIIGGQAPVGYQPPVTQYGPPPTMVGQAPASYQPPATQYAPQQPQPQPQVYSYQPPPAMFSQPSVGMGTMQLPPQQLPPTTVTAPPVFMQEPSTQMHAAPSAMGAPQFMTMPAPAQQQFQGFQQLAPTTVVAPPVYMTGPPMPQPTEMYAAPPQEPSVWQTAQPSYQLPPQQRLAPTTVTAPPVHIQGPPMPPMTHVAEMYDQVQEPMFQQYQLPPQLRPQFPPTTVTAPPVYASAPQGYAQAPQIISQGQPQMISYAPPQQEPTTISTAPPMYLPPQAQPQFQTQAQPSYMYAQEAPTYTTAPQIYVDYRGEPIPQPHMVMEQAPPQHMFAPQQVMTAAPVYLPAQPAPPQMMEPATTAPAASAAQYLTAPAEYMTMPTVMAPQPTSYASPQTFLSAPQTVYGGAPAEPVAGGGVQYMQPQTSYAQPPTIYQVPERAQPGPGDLFSQIDRNHDGVITRDEFAAGFQYPQ